MKNEKGRGELIKVLLLILVFPLMPIIVGLNILGTADRLSGLPGIEEGGGIISGVVVMFITCIGLVLVLGGAIWTGAEIPFFDSSGNPPEAESNHPIETPTPSRKTTPIAPSPQKPAEQSEKSKKQQLEDFEGYYKSVLSKTIDNKTITGVPVLASGYHSIDRGKKELWIVFWECDQSIPLNHQRATIANYLVTTIGHHNGSHPHRVLIYGVSDLENFDDTIFTINTSYAERTVYRNVSLRNYTKTWLNRQRSPNSLQTERAYQMVINESGKNIAEEAFKNEHREIRGCHAGAMEGTG